MNLETATIYANELIEFFKQYCERIEIAGGIRRKKDEPHDIEIVAIPKFTDATLGFFQPVMENSLDSKIKGLLHDGGWDLTHTLGYGDKDKKGKRAPCGPKYYRLKYRGEKLDLFAVLPPAQWGVIFAIRTGDAEFSHWLVQQGWDKGIVVSDGAVEQCVNKDGSLNLNCGGTVGTFDFKPLDTPEESDVFRILGVSYIEPEKRIGTPK